MKRNLQKYIAAEAAFREFLNYDPETGMLTWAKRPYKGRCVAGDTVGSTMPTGYIVFKLHGDIFYAHHVAWWLHTGKWPKVELDHKDCDPSNNRFSNLREATKAQNCRNVRPYSRTGAGLKGAYTHPSMNGKWFAQIVVDGKQIYLGRFSTEALAHEAYVSASAKYHGEFARAAA